MDWSQYEAWCKQWTGPCGHNWSPGCEAGCHTPCQPWSDRPTGHTNPPPMNFCPPPIPKPIPGESPMECMNRLYSEVCACMKQCGELNAKAETMLKDLHTYGLKNGAYYGPDVINVQEGYQADDGSPYKVISIKHKDHYGCPVEVKLHLAYGNTTNAGIKEQAEDASLFELAQIMVPAIGDVNKWYGKVIYEMAPLPSENAPYKYTYGFTRHGTLKVYKNSYIDDNPNILERDTIVTAMGCDGILIKDGIVTSGQDVLNVSKYNEKAARILMGQNSNTKEIFILVAGGWGEDYPGVTCPHAVEILKGYGCTVAVQLISGDDTVALDKGDLVAPPAEDVVPDNVAYLYVSKKRFFKNELQYNLAYMTQMMNQFKFKNFLYDKQAKYLADKIQNEIEDRRQGDASLQGRIEQEVRAREDAYTEIKEDLQIEIDNRTNEDEALHTELDKEKADRYYADTVLQENIDAEQKAREAQDIILENKIKEEAETRQQVDETLNTQINDEINRATTAEQRLNTALLDEVNRATASETELSNAIQNEATRATSAEADLHSDITREETRALGAEADLKRTIETLHDDVIQEFKHYSEDLKADIDQKFDQFMKDYERMRDEVETLKVEVVNGLNSIQSKVDEAAEGIEDRLDAKYETTKNEVEVLKTEVVNGLNSIPKKVEAEGQRIEGELTPKYDELERVVREEMAALIQTVPHNPLTEGEIQSLWDDVFNGG